LEQGISKSFSISFLGHTLGTGFCSAAFKVIKQTAVFSNTPPAAGLSGVRSGVIRIKKLTVPHTPHPVVTSPLPCPPLLRPLGDGLEIKAALIPRLFFLRV